MLKSRKGCGIYRDTLNKEARDRYMDKIGTINGLDPYEVPNKEWSTNKDLLPQFSITDILDLMQPLQQVTPGFVMHVCSHTAVQRHILYIIYTYIV